MYNKILSEISQEYYQQNYPNDGQRFVAWYLRNIHNLDTYETKDCITDGAGDKQIDAVYIDNQSSTIYIIQGKFYSGDSLGHCLVKNSQNLQGLLWEVKYER